MTDATLAAVSAPTALIQAAAAEGAAPSAGTQPSDLFAELMATVAAASPAATIAVASGHTPAPSPALAAVAAEALPRGSMTPTTVASERNSDETEAKDGSDDPLADAIANGATAVLALAPEIVPSAPVAPPGPLRAAQGAPTPAAVSTITMAGLNASTRPLPRSDTRLPPSQPHEGAPAAGVRSGGPALQASQGPIDRGPAERQPASTPPALPPIVGQMPATNQDRADQLAAAITTLKPSVAAPAALTATPPPAALAPAQTAAPVQKMATNPAGRQAPSLRGPAQIRTDKETRLSHASADTHRRPDAFTADSLPAGLTERAYDRRAPSFDTAAVVPKGDAIIQQTLSIARDGAWLDTLARDIAGAAGSGNDLHFKLEPPNLGSLTVAIAQSSDGASIRMTADTDTTRNILLDAQPRLIAEARAHGLKVTDTQVDLGNQNQGSSQDGSRWAQGSQRPDAGAQNGQNRQSSPAHQPFVSNLARTSEAEAESSSRDSDALYA